MALCAGNSGTKRGREMIKGSKDVARVLVGTEKKNFSFGGSDFL